MTQGPLFSLSPASTLDDLLEANQRWRRQQEQRKPALFRSHAAGQTPHTLFLACCDSRYSEACLGVEPGEAFTYRTIANIMDPADPGFRAALEFALHVLQVSRIVLCGHTNCGGVSTCLTGTRRALATPQCSSLHAHLDSLDALCSANKPALASLPPAVQAEQLVIANVRAQYRALSQDAAVRAAVQQRHLTLHALLYHVDTGALTVVAP
ncbi:ADL226Cp [Eremothecium gossypii ATCC 10895]|uniref:Carbonic anhydrase n=1 Tax=Eremothecium gossypii (strain ATCC 10895 / CBS 109.51 / FGSC 9923 / NRRL Y-1056) TaxID=284811 RepID=Q75AZ6_EREGS|nr:ADL226Cp [Eremothecium gossypii ATCC 10895]AAS51694.1 ADL226Cp [Eremothecium gossypii ATCC 10895]AEY95991.1 FADL226Cp [Eremothecium gossypii FDAG1]